MGSEITSKHFLVGGDPYGLSVRTIGSATPQPSGKIRGSGLGEREGDRGTQEERVKDRFVMYQKRQAHPSQPFTLRAATHACPSAERGDGRAS